LYLPFRFFITWKFVCDVDLDGILRTIGGLDYENHTEYILSVQARDLGDPSKSSTSNITVDVIDINDTFVPPVVPHFNKTIYTATLSPYTQANVSVLLVDAGYDVHYTITGKFTFFLNNLNDYVTFSYLKLCFMS